MRIDSIDPFSIIFLQCPILNIFPNFFRGVKLIDLKKLWNPTTNHRVSTCSSATLWSLRRSRQKEVHLFVHILSASTWRIRLTSSSCSFEEWIQRPAQRNPNAAGRSTLWENFLSSVHMQDVWEFAKGKSVKLHRKNMKTCTWKQKIWRVKQVTDLKFSLQSCLLALEPTLGLEGEKEWSSSSALLSMAGGCRTWMKIYSDFTHQLTSQNPSRHLRSDQFPTELMRYQKEVLQNPV